MARQDGDAYRRAVTDPVFLAAVAAAHTGRWGVLDALWWQGRPEDAAPEGTPSPLATLRVLQRRVFAADADAAGDHGVHARLQALEAEIARETAAINVALTAAHAGVDAALAVGTEPHHANVADDAATEDVVDPADATDRGFPEPPPTWRRRALLAAGLIAAVALGAVGGSQLTAATQPAAAPTVAEAAAATAAAAAASAAATSPTLAMSIFQREPMPEDLPAVALPDEFDMSTVRALGSMGTVDADPTWTTYYYVARTTSTLVCLIVVPPKTSSLSTCTLEEDFTSTGLRLYWQAQGIFFDTGTATGPVDTFLIWRPDGSVETGSAG